MGEEHQLDGNDTNILVLLRYNADLMNVIYYQAGPKINKHAGEFEVQVSRK